MGQPPTQGRGDAGADLRSPASPGTRGAPSPAPRARKVTSAAQSTSTRIRRARIGHADVCIPQGAIDRLEQLARYAARPPIVEDRLSLSADGSHVTYRFRRPFRDGSFHVVLSCREFIARLAALIPRPRAHLVTYHSGDPPGHDDLLFA